MLEAKFGLRNQFFLKEKSGRYQEVERQGVNAEQATGHICPTISKDGYNIVNNILWIKNLAVPDMLTYSTPVLVHILHSVYVLWAAILTLWYFSFLIWDYVTVQVPSVNENYG